MSTPLQRQWRLLQMLARRTGAAVREMAEENGVSQKTIRRDLDTLQAVGFALVEEVGPHRKKWWRLQSDNTLPPPTFNQDELTALHLGRRFLEPLAGTVFADAARSALAKIRAGLPETALAYLEKLATRVYCTSFGAGDYADRRDVLEVLRTGVEDCCVTTIAYQSLRATKPATYDVHPYGLVLYRDSLYLVAFSVEHDEVRHFKVDRLTDAEVRRPTFACPADFDLSAHLERSFGIYEKPGPPTTVRLRFRQEVAPYVAESRWHPSQRLTRTADGHLLAEFEVTGLEEVQSWVLSFGAKCEVLEPQELCEAISEELVSLTSIYTEVETSGVPASRQS